MPTWPRLWLSHINGFENFVPILCLPGPLLALALWLRRDSDAHLLLLASLTPQHWFYDSFILWLIPKSRLEILTTACLSWGVVLFWRLYPFAHAAYFSPQVGSLAVMWIYLPMLTLLLMRVTLFSKPRTEEFVLPARGRFASAGAKDLAA
jgi:hypothetical protein